MKKVNYDIAHFIAFNMVAYGFHLFGETIDEYVARSRAVWDYFPEWCEKFLTEKGIPTENIMHAISEMLVD